MSSAGAVVPVPQGYNDPDKFPMAKGYYTHKGGWFWG